jgi:hypothetical protein
MTFYRLRSALRRLGYGHKLTPASDLRVLERGRTKSNLEKLEVETGLRLPRSGPTSLANRAALFGFIVTWLVVFALQPSADTAVLGLVLGLAIVDAIFRFDPGKLSESDSTLAGFTRATTAMNYGRLVKMGARPRDKDVWDNLVEALSCYLPRPEITRETFFLESQLRNRSTA